MIIDKKINYYIKKGIETKETENKIQDLIKGLIDANFKRDALKEKFYIESTIKDLNNLITIKEDELYLSGDKQYEKDKVKNIDNPIEYLYESIKYDFYTT
jgi:hypothetical protein